MQSQSNKLKAYYSNFVNVSVNCKLSSNVKLRKVISCRKNRKLEQLI